MKVLTSGSYLAAATVGVEPMVPAARAGVVRLSGLSGSVRSLWLAAAALEAGRTVVVAADEQAVAHLRQDLKAVLPELAAAGACSAPSLLSFPPLEADPYQGVGAHPQVLAERAATLAAMRRRQRWVVLASFSALLPPLLPVAQFEALYLTLKCGDPFPFDALAARLERSGYRRVDMAVSPGDWARRGGIFDVFPPGLDEPVRIELEDDQVASLRLFDPYSQRSLEQRQEVEIPPARETPPGPEDLQELIRRLERTPRTGGRTVVADPLESLVVEGSFAGMELCAGLWGGRETGLLDYGPGALLVEDEPFRIETEVGALASELAASREATSSILPPPDRLLLPAARLAELLAGPRLELHDLSLDEVPGEDGAPAAGPRPQAAPAAPVRQVEVSGRAPRAYFGRLDDLAADLETAAAAGRQTLLLLETEGLLERTREVLQERGLDPAILPATVPQGGELPRLALARGRLAHGFELPGPGLTVLTEGEIFGERRTRKPRGGRRAAPFRSDFRDLAVGDLVVHVDHGIGRYQGIKRMGQEQGGKEFMILIYGGDAVLYVPMDRLDLVQRYSGAGGKPPRLDRLGAPGWEKVRGKVRKEMQDLADHLLELYAARRALPGRAFGADGPWQQEFESAFPYQETPDQLQAVIEIKRDMESSQTMDRLLCGDVGFGKTEVAMRAAFKAVMEGAQVAILAPTTVLVFQHLSTLRDRFAAFPVTIEMLSRFQNRAQQADVVCRLMEGSVDIVVGTHRLLSKDVGFKDLGLLVVDEEQRFGVSHKERLKQMRTNVDVLTLTATPIPRTLQMSLAGVRDLSVIETPPENRMSIHTLLLPFRPGIVAQAVRREIRRGGQIFFVHNRISSIGAMASLLRHEVPEVTLEVAHGQMGEKELEDIMLRFMAGEFQLLLTTSIIENGLDIPRANTIIVNRSDRFGLAQLYQLRGRVGRSDVRAYAYLLIPSLQELSDVARQRLKALQEFSELGAGFRVAARDLEIRGAGELLGGKQHGHIAALGFDLYCRMLEQAVAEKQGGAAPAPEVRVAMDLGVDYRLPSNYVPEAHQRLILYKRVAAAAEEGELDRVREEIEDRFGHLPVEAENLLEMAALRNHAERLGIATITAAGDRLSFHFVDGAPLDPGRLLYWVRSCPGVTLGPTGLLAVPVPADPEARLQAGRQVLEELAGMVQPQGTPS